MEGLFVIILLIVLVVRTINKQKKSIKASREKYRPEDFGASAEPQSAPQRVQEGRAPVQQRIDLDRGQHRHVERVHTQAGGYAGEGDEKRYHTREVSCETVGHTEAAESGIKIPELKGENLASAVILSEILGKPKALRR